MPPFPPRRYRAATLVLLACMASAGCAANEPEIDDAGVASDGAGSGGDGDGAGDGAGHGGSAGDGVADGRSGGDGDLVVADGDGVRPPPDAPPAIDGVIEPGDPGPADVTLTVRADRELHLISPLIYGINGAREIARTRQTLVRSGGNRLTAYNWENNASNAGSDWMFQNDGFLSESSEPGRVALDVVEEASAHGAASIVTVPNVDYVSADKNGGGDVRGSGADYLQTRFRQNRPRKDGALSSTPDVGDDFVYQDEFVAWLREAAPDGARVLFSMDNEPDLWAHTHAQVHPDKVTYEELWQRNRDYADAVKSVWPEAEVLGVVSYGFNGYVSLQDAPDAGGRNFLEWYLQQARADEETRGQRLIDYLDLHWYPEARGGGTRVTESGSDEALVEARLQAPRSLWDRNYVEDSWIADALNGPIHLLSWVQEKIDAHYPGTKLAITEWNYGGGNHISGALAVADVLGIFGREGVHLAAYWPLSETEPFALSGFRVFRNYDGQGGRFGDTSIEATTSNVDAVTVYASIDSGAPERTVIVAINKSTQARTAALSIAHPTAFARASVWTVAGGEAELVAGDALSASADNAFLVELPARSASVIVPAP